MKTSIYILHAHDLLARVKYTKLHAPERENVRLTVVGKVNSLEENFSNSLITHEENTRKIIKYIVF